VFEEGLHGPHDEESSVDGSQVTKIDSATSGTSDGISKTL
jgi:hypothetical protein